MGVYFTTYVCQDQVPDKNSVCVSVMDQAIEPHEVAQGFVDRSEIVRVLTKQDIEFDPMVHRFVVEVAGSPADGAIVTRHLPVGPDLK